VFLLAVLVERAAPARKQLEAAGAAARVALAPALARARAILPIALLSGAVSFAYEVLWTRLLGHVLGGSIYAFATMLASVLVGIAVGGALGARFATSPRAAARGFAWAQLATALLAVAAFRALDWVPALAAQIGAGSSAGLAANAALAMAILVPPALAIGTTFPFAVRVLARGPEDASPASARVYAWNTAGAITGSIAAGFFVLPALGYAGTLGSRPARTCSSPSRPRGWRAAAPSRARPCSGSRCSRSRGPASRGACCAPRRSRAGPPAATSRTSRSGAPRPCWCCAATADRTCAPTACPSRASSRAARGPAPSWSRRGCPRCPPRRAPISTG
jgi:hypothetical protein